MLALCLAFRPHPTKRFSTLDPIMISGAKKTHPSALHRVAFGRIVEQMLGFVKESFLIMLFFTLLTGLILYKVIFIMNISAISSVWTAYGIIASIFLVSRIPYSYLHQDDHDGTYVEELYPSVSIVIAAKNEEEGIFKTITTCIESDYPNNIECIVINDGSTDGTEQEIKRAQLFFREKRVRLISFEENRGKREAMAAGIQSAQNEIVVFVDSDSFLAPKALKHIAEHFIADESIGAVSGNTKVENINENLLTRMQSIQYAVSFDIYKASESVHSSVTCCPGCFSAYRRSALLQLVDAWKNHAFFGSKSTFGDDRGLTNFILQKWNIVYCQKALATTTVPEKFSIYWRQQMRWKKSWIREGIFASTFMWKKRHPFASLAFYIHFSFPIVGPILVGTVLATSIITKNPSLFLIFISGFLLLGAVFALFVRVYHKADNWMIMPLYSFLFVTIFIWQMPIALLKLRDTSWGTR